MLEESKEPEPREENYRNVFGFSNSREALG
jgi:hypothetical protein